MDAAQDTLNPPKLKTCTACGIAKPLVEFFQDKRRKEPRATCKECGKEYYRAWYHQRENALNLARAAQKKKKQDREWQEVLDGGRVCVTCGENKPITEFFKHSRSSRGYKRICKACEIAGLKRWRHENPEDARKRARAARIRMDYGMSTLEFQAMVEAQENCCKICDKEFHPDGGYAGPYVDHNHSTGKVRELLCFECNSGLGRFKDNPELLKRAASYLEKHKSDG
jgi:hypothetical protein